MIQKIDMQVAKATAIGNSLAVFIGRNVKSNKDNRDETTRIAKAVFFKWGTQQGIANETLREYTGDTDGTSRYIKTQFSMKNHEHKDIWDRWKIFIQEVESRIN